MKRSVFTIILAGLVLLTGLGFAVLSMSRPTPVDARAMTAANELVATGHYAEAAQMYEQLIAQGARDAALYYNLGNATLSLGDANRAVTAYERAAALAPRDPDIRANRTLAQRASLSSHVTLSGSTGQLPSRRAFSEESPRPTGQDSSLFSPAGGALGTDPLRTTPKSRSDLALGGLADVTGRWLTVDELALLALSAWFTLGLLVFAYRGLQPERRPTVVRVAVVVAFLVMLATGGMLAGRMAALQLAAPATIMGEPPTGSRGQQAAAPTGVCLQGSPGCANSAS